MEPIKSNEVKVIFVGMHNKPGKEPLDSTTKSGKVIDRIIRATGIKAIKTNLVDLDYFPDSKETFDHASNWAHVNSPDENDIVVLLGNWVHQNFPYGKVNCKIVKLPHPASSCYGTIRVAAYVDNAILNLTSKLETK